MITALLAAVLSAAPHVVGDASNGGRVIVLVHQRAQLDAVTRGGGVEVIARFQSMDGFVAKVTGAAWKRLAHDERVRSIEVDRVLRPHNGEAGTLTGARQVEQTLGFIGRGVRIAVLDTGVDRTHPDLDGGIIAEKCFVQPNGCPPAGTNVGDLAPDIALGHGTHIAGTLTGNGPLAPRGIAAGSELVMVRVFDAVAYGNEADWALALDWVLTQRATYGFRLVNLSMGTDDAYTGACDSAWPAMGDAVARLRDAGVAAFSSTGNSAIDGGITAPACLAATISVGAVYDADLAREPDTGTYSSGCVDQNATAGSVICFSNSTPTLDLLAPGSRIRSTANGGGVTEKRGTSQAAAHATAVAALLLEADPLLTVDDLEQILEQTGVATVDPKTNITSPRIDAAAAVARVLQTQCARRASGAGCKLSASTNGTCSGTTCTAATMDAGTDAGTTTDAGTVPTDAGTMTADAGPKTIAEIEDSWPAAPGCSSAPALLIALTALLTRRRR